MQAISNFYNNHINGNQTLEKVLKGVVVTTAAVALVSAVALAALFASPALGVTIATAGLIKAVAIIGVASGLISVAAAIFARVIHKSDAPAGSAPAAVAATVSNPSSPEVSSDDVTVTPASVPAT